MLSSVIMPDMSFADDFSSEQSKNQANSLEPQSVSENVYASPTAIPVQTATNEPMVTLLPGVTSTPTPTPELGLPTGVQDETRSITLPLEESEEDQNRVRLYTKVVINQPEFDYTNNSSFTIVRPYEFNTWNGDT